MDVFATADERNYAGVTHGVGLLALPTLGLPILGPLVTLVLWLARRSQSPFLNDHGREAMNFQISIILYSLAAWALGGLLAPITFGMSVAQVGIVHVAILALVLIGVIRGITFARRGQYFRYPMCVRFLKDDAERPRPPHGPGRPYRSQHQTPFAAAGQDGADTPVDDDQHQHARAGAARRGPYVCFGASPALANGMRVDDRTRERLDDATRLAKRCGRRASIAAAKAARDAARAMRDTDSPRRRPAQ
jgi:hypothetical protein